MTFTRVIKRAIWRVRTNADGWTSRRDLVRHEVEHACKQLRATAFQCAHLISEAGVRHATRDGKEHKALDYPDPPDHVVIGCLCDKEWS